MEQQKTCLLRSSLVVRRIVFRAVFLAIFLFPQSGYAQTTPEVTTLESGKPLEREIAGGQKHSYQIDLSVGQYFMATVEQRGVDVLARLFDGDGKPIAEFDAEMRLNGTEKIEFVAKTAGKYRLDIEPRYKLLPSGKYEIRLADSHAATEPEKSLQEARNLYAESARLFNAGKYDESQELIEKAIEIRRRELGAENPRTATALTHLARILDSQGKYDEALKLNERVLLIRQKILGEDHPDVAYTLNYLGLNYNHKEDYQNAVLFHQKALAVREKVFGANHPIVAVSLINLGVVYDKLGDKLKAGELYQRALTIQEQTVGAENLNVAIILNNIGKIYNDLEEYKKAEPFLLRSLAMLEKLFVPDNPRIFDMLTNLAECYAGQSNLDKAESLYQRILQFREKTVGENHPLTAHTAFNLGNLYALKGDLEKSETFYRRALEIRENTLGTENPGVAEVLSGLALLLAKKGDIAQALKNQQRADVIDERNMSLNLAIGSERQKIAYINSLSERINQNFVIQNQFAPDNPFAIELAATTALRQKGRVLDAVSNSLIELRRRFDPQDRALIDKLNENTQELAELILNGREETPLAEYQSKIKTLADDREKLEDEISRRTAGFYAKSQAVTLSSVQAVIPVNSVLIEFAIYTPTTKSDKNSSGEPRYVAYILHNRGEVNRLEIGTVKEIDASIEGFRQTLRDPKRDDVGQLARAVDKKVMSPIRALLGDATQLLISPDGNLNLIPFEALVDEQNHYLIENYSFTYLTSGRDLLRMQTPRTSKNKPLLIANPAFDLSVAAQTAKLTKPTKRNVKRQSITATRNLSDTYFAPLGGTAQEARSIQTLFPEATFLTGAQATESALKQIAAPRILHIATHGFFLQNDETSVNAKIENPLLRSGLALAGANQRKSGKEDGILTALEASGLNLWGTKLVVLSACDTGLGEVRNGEGVYGLRRAFVLAGTESLVMSLWSVSDYVTRELMTNYYKNLKQGMGRGAALRQVQLEMLKKNGRQHPFYWASFIQSGEWANLEGKR